MSAGSCRLGLVWQAEGSGRRMVQPAAGARRRQAKVAAGVASGWHRAEPPRPEAIASRLTNLMPIPARWDIFCKVVDNFGDAGVSWRLARQLVSEHALDVTLWLDDLAALARMAPGVDPVRDAQSVSGVALRRWVEPFPRLEPADVVVEAFGCALPESYLAAMATRVMPPTWILLEYMSAETWVEGAHDVASPHPKLPLERRLIFPGFAANTGGLLRERGLVGARDAFQRDPAAQGLLWSSLGVPPPAERETRVSLFCYPNAALPALLDAWADGEASISCLVPEGIAAGALDAWTRGNVPHPGHPYHCGRLTLYGIPFVAQDDYDHLLWASDVNFVRGEDSFVRAQWAARPLAWHIYPQAEGAHWRKLDAFLDRYAEGLDPVTEATVRRFWRAYNVAPEAGSIGDAWLEFAAARPHLESHAVAWGGKLASLADLASTLVTAGQARV